MIYLREEGPPYPCYERTSFLFDFSSGEKLGQRKVANRCEQLSAQLGFSLTLMKFALLSSFYRVMEFGQHVVLRSAYSCEWRKVDSYHIWHHEEVLVGSALLIAKAEL